MTQQVLLTGSLAEPTEINVLWSNRNNVQNGCRVEIAIDSNYCLHICANGVSIASVTPGPMAQEVAQEIRGLIGCR